MGLLFLSGALLPGCVLFQKQYVVYPDPLRKKVVRIEGISGREVTLADGQVVTLAGLNVKLQALWSGSQKRWLADSRQKACVGRYVAVFKEADGKVRLVEVSLENETKISSGGCGLPMGLIPIFIERKPPRTDIGADLVCKGLAKPVPDELKRSKTKKEYLEDLQEAQQY